MTDSASLHQDDVHRAIGIISTAASTVSGGDTHLEQMRTPLANGNFSVASQAVLRENLTSVVRTLQVSLLTEIITPVVC